MIAPVSLKLRGNELSAGLRKLVEFGPRGAAHVANKAVHSIAIKAHNAMPVVSPDRITAEMESSVMISGKNSSIITRRTRAQSIILASMHPNSRFNLRTGGVWRRQKPVFSGDRVTRRLKFWEWVNAKAEHMTKARRSSSGFYKLGCAVVRLIFSKNRAVVRTVPGQLAGSEAATQPGDGKVGKAIGRVAGGTLATAGSPNAKFWVSTTEPDSKGGQEGINRVLQPVWQRSVDAESAYIHKYADELFAQAIREAGFTVK